MPGQQVCCDHAGRSAWKDLQWRRCRLHGLENESEAFPSCPAVWWRTFCWVSPAYENCRTISTDVLFGLLKAAVKPAPSDFHFWNMHWLHRLPSLESNVCCFCCFLSDHYWCRSAQEKKGAEADCHFSTYLTAANHSHLSQVLISGERCQDPRNGVTPPNRQMCTILASSSVRSSKGDSGCGEILQSAFHVNWGAKCKTFSRKCFCVQCLRRVILVATCKYYITLVSRVSSFSWPAYFFNSHIFTIPGRRSQLHSAFSFSFVRDLFLCECWYQAVCIVASSTALQDLPCGNPLLQGHLWPLFLYQPRCPGDSGLRRTRSRTTWKLPWWLSYSRDSQDLWEHWASFKEMLGEARHTHTELSLHEYNHEKQRKR